MRDRDDVPSQRRSRIVWVWCGFLALCLLLTQKFPGGYAPAGRRILIGTSTHPYVFAFSPSRHIVEWPTGWWRIFYYNGTSVMAATVHHGRLVGAPQAVSRCPAAPGFSITLSDDMLYLVYSDSGDITAFLRTATLKHNALQFTDARKIISGPRSFSVQAASVAMSPEKRLTLIYREIYGSPNQFPIYFLQATDRFGTSWGEPEKVSSPMQEQRSGPGTSGAIFWPGGQPVVILGAGALYANVRTESGWIPHLVDADYKGVHDYSGVVAGETLYLSYLASPMMRWIQYHPQTGWSQPVTLGTSDIHATAMGLTSDLKPVIFGYANQGSRWRIWSAMGSARTAGTVSWVDRRNVRYCWLAVPQRAQSLLCCAWVEGNQAPYQIYCWVGPVPKQQALPAE